MLQRWLRFVISRPLIRIALATVLLVAGLAPVGAPILSDSTWRQADQSLDQVTNYTPQPAPFTYRWAAINPQITHVERSGDGGQTWHSVAKIPAAIMQLQATRGDEQTVFARSAEAIWISRDGGASWSSATALPSRPLALAATGKSAGLLLVGTESVGLVVSRDLGESWQALQNPLVTDGSAPLAISALAVDPTDDSILYMAAGIWLGTTTTRLTAIGTFVSVDGGRGWLELARAPLGAAPVTQLSPVADRPLTVMAQSAQGVETLSMTLSPELLAQLENQDAGVRGSAARAIGLIGDTAAAPALLTRLTDSDPLAGDRAAEALGRLGDTSVVPALLDALDTADEAVRARAARALGLLQAQDAVDALETALRAGIAPTARRAAEALAAIGTPEALTTLTAPLADAAMTPARHSAMIGLELAGEKAVQPLMAALASDDAALRANATEMLAWVRANEASPSRPYTRSFGEALLGHVSQIPPTRWTLLIITMALAAALLWLRPQQGRQRHI